MWIIGLRSPPALKIHDVFHVDRLSPYKGNTVNGLEPPPPEPVTVEGEEEYEVDHIRDSKALWSYPQIPCPLERFMEKEKTPGKPMGNLKHAPEKLTAFHDRKPRCTP